MCVRAPPPLLSGVPLDEEPVQHQWQHGHEAQVEPVVQLRGLSAAFTHLLEVGPLSTRTDLAGHTKTAVIKNSIQELLFFSFHCKDINLKFIRHYSALRSHFLAMVVRVHIHHVVFVTSSALRR